ncbi:uncharacterized protein LOC116349170 [Contarinia nasturtii]|uniref:uncharacterized protein LOC116349170 n=1 Tax=Contarinia nasturtii TaxID=265458 RepID=UPI0012D42FDD|nr:uncharacterized protein LOC116349170 [Contarinia nasturtii]
MSGRKRKGVGAICGSRPKRRKVGKLPEESGLLAIKVSAATAVKEEYHDIVLPWIAKKSIECTKICELASLLFLHKVKLANEEAILTNNWKFFDEGDGIHIIEGCFFAVLRKYKEENDMVPEFRDIVEALDGDNRFAWPNNDYFGNLMRYLFQQHARNAITNLTTHDDKRLREYLRLLVWEHNVDNLDPNDVFDEHDVNNAVKWAIERYDSTRGDAIRLDKRNRLLTCVRNIGGPKDDNIAKDTKENWFATLPMWLHMQKKIDDYHNWVQNNLENIPADIELPIIKNLSVLPICTHLRKNIKINADILYRMMCETKIIPLDEYGRQVDGTHVCENKVHYFNEIFDMNKINGILNANKEFHYHVVTDGVSASILYDVSRNTLEQLVSDELIKKRYEDGVYIYELGIDPGMKTWNATVRRHIDSGKEMNFKTSSKKYHYLTKQGVRNRKAKRWTRGFVAFEQNDRNDRTRYPQMPSPKGENWRDYISHRLRIMKKAIDVYTSERYTRLRFDKYIESNRVCDKIAAMLTNGKPCIIFLGAANISPNSPIKIKKNIRCPGNRKLIKSFKKMLGNVVKMVNEFRTSRLCARCFEPFPLETLGHRFKVCEWCVPDNNDWPEGLKLPEKIVTMKSKRMLLSERQELRDAMVANPNQAVGFVSKVICYRKNWRQNAAYDAVNNVAQLPGIIRDENVIDFTEDYMLLDDDFYVAEEEAILNTIWHRDIAAAKLIIYKGNLFIELKLDSE